MAGGDEAPFEKARPVIEAYAKAVTLMGPSGSGQLTKMVNQICIAGLIQGLAEGLNFAAKAGLDAKLAVDVISKGAAQSWQMDNRAKTMLWRTASISALPSTGCEKTSPYVWTKRGPAAPPFRSQH